MQQDIELWCSKNVASGEYIKMNFSLHLIALLEKKFIYNQIIWVIFSAGEQLTAVVKLEPKLWGEGGYPVPMISE